MTTSLNFFSIPALNPAVAQAEPNLFMQQHRVVNLEKRWVADGAVGFGYFLSKFYRLNALKTPVNRASSASSCDAFSHPNSPHPGPVLGVTINTGYGLKYLWVKWSSACGG
jgi:hypothetical protein